MDGSILLVDKDLGLLFWLGRILDRAGYQAFPARSVPDAMALLRELHLTVTTLILNCAMPEAESLISTLRRSHRSVRVICLNENGPHVCVTGTDAACRKPVEFSEPSKTKWVKAFRELLSYTPDFTRLDLDAPL